MIWKISYFKEAWKEILGKNQHKWQFIWTINWVHPSLRFINYWVDWISVTLIIFWFWMWQHIIQQNKQLDSRLNFSIFEKISLWSDCLCHCHGKSRWCWTRVKLFIITTSFTTNVVQLWFDNISILCLCISLVIDTF